MQAEQTFALLKARQAVLDERSPQQAEESKGQQEPSAGMLASLVRTSLKYTPGLARSEGLHVQPQRHGGGRQTAAPSPSGALSTCSTRSSCDCAPARGRAARRTSPQWLPGAEARSCRDVPGATQAQPMLPLQEAELLLARMRRAEELCSLQSSFVHPLNFQESLVCQQLSSLHAPTAGRLWQQLAAACQCVHGTALALPAAGGAARTARTPSNTAVCVGLGADQGTAGVQAGMFEPPPADDQALADTMGLMLNCINSGLYMARPLVFPAGQLRRAAALSAAAQRGEVAIPAPRR